jgi:hypothetical protein
LENIMNILKHMEAAFIFSLSAAALASVAVDSMPQARAVTPVQAVAAIDPSIAVVKVSAKRLTPVQKAQLLAMERGAKRA